MQAGDKECQSEQLGVWFVFSPVHNLCSCVPESARLPPDPTTCFRPAGVRAAIAEAPRHAAPAAHASADVGLKDAPLRSLYPDELPPPAPVPSTPSLQEWKQRIL